MRRVIRDSRADFQKVSEAHEAVLDIEDRILEYRATPDEVMTWYLAQDPLTQNLYEMTADVMSESDPSLFPRLIDDDARSMTVMQHAAGTLAAHALLPIGESDATTWYPLLCTRYQGELAGGALSCVDVINCAFELSDKEQLSASDLYDLKIVVEMLTATSTTSLIESAKLIEDTGDVIGAYKMLTIERPITERMDSERNMSLELSQIILQGCLDGMLEDQDIRKVALDALPFIGALLMSTASAPGSSFENVDSHEIRTDTIDLYMDMLELIATGPYRIQLMGKSTKGPLHEAVWFLDMMILREIRKGQFYVWHSTTNQDQPKIGYPDYNRGFDFMLTCEGRPEYVVQLKSAPKSQLKKNDQDYHPEIAKKYERNFQEFNGNALAAKLHLYRQYLGGGTDALKEKVELKVLDTAREVYDEYEAIGDISHQYMIQKLGNFGITFSTPPINYDRRIQAVLNGEADPGFSRRHRRLLQVANREPRVKKPASAIPPTKRTGSTTKKRGKKRK